MNATDQRTRCKTPFSLLVLVNPAFFSDLIDPVLWESEARNPANRCKRWCATRVAGLAARQVILWPQIYHGGTPIMPQMSPESSTFRPNGILDTSA